MTYTYDSVGRRTRVTYPSGRMVNYTFDAQGRISGVTTRQDAGGDVQPVVSGVNYKPFGPVTNFTYGNDLQQTMDYDLDYRVSNIRTGVGGNDVQNSSYGYDPVNNITEIARWPWFRVIVRLSVTMNSTA